MQGSFEVSGSIRGSKPRPVEFTDVGQRVLDFMRDRPRATSREIVGALGLSLSTATFWRDRARARLAKGSA